MKQKYRVEMGTPDPMGVSVMENHIHVAIAFARKPVKECGIILYDGNRLIARIAFQESLMTGLLYTVSIYGISAKKLRYQFFLDDEIFVDPYAKRIIGREKWGRYQEADKALWGEAACPDETFDWSGDTCLQIPYEDSILYSLHVRGFTKHPSSGVQCRGTFEGLTEKIPYLKELGINAILCMPFYEFDEVIRNPAYQEIPTKLQEYMTESEPAWKYRINYWGFGDKGNYYMAPKAAYATVPADAESSLKNMVKAMHQNGIEVLQQIYFAPEVSLDYIRDVLRFWVMEYHLDGFQLLGTCIPERFLAQDPILGKTKLIFEKTDEAAGQSASGRGYEKNMARYSDGFRSDCRRFLKGDENMIYSISRYLMESSTSVGVIHHITDYRGFTLMDLFSYERKHNETNGEGNRDGSDYNFSWNCGQEGATRKKTVLALRLAERKNAMILLLLGKATPLLLAGDEMGRTTGGNNNPYCQDNKINWLNWNLLESDKEFFGFVRQCIAFRKAHPVLRSSREMKLIDTLSCGYPDVSFHSEQAWYTRFESYNRHLGMLYCGLYEKTESGTDDFIYLLMNMHWTDHAFALVQLPDGYRWRVAFSTRDFEEKTVRAQEKQEGRASVTVMPRSIVVLTASKDKEENRKEAKA